MLAFTQAERKSLATGWVCGQGVTFLVAIRCAYNNYDTVSNCCRPLKMNCWRHVHNIDPVRYHLCLGLKKLISTYYYVIPIHQRGQDNNIRL